MDSILAKYACTTFSLVRRPPSISRASSITESSSTPESAQAGDGPGDAVAIRPVALKTINKIASNRLTPPLEVFRPRFDRLEATTAAADGQS